MTKERIPWFIWSKPSTTRRLDISALAVQNGKHVSWTHAVNAFQHRRLLLQLRPGEACNLVSKTSRPVGRLPRDVFRFYSVFRLPGVAKSNFRGHLTVCSFAADISACTAACVPTPTRPLLGHVGTRERWRTKSAHASTKSHRQMTTSQDNGEHAQRCTRKHVC